MNRTGQHTASANAVDPVPLPWAAVLGGGTSVHGLLNGGAAAARAGPSKKAKDAKDDEIGSGGEEDDDDDDDDEQKKPGRRKISIQFINDKSKRHITFSKRKAGVIKKARELSSLTGAQVLLIVTSETGNIYEFSTPKFGKVLETFKTWYQTCSKDSKRIEGATGLKLGAGAAAENQQGADNDMDAQSQRRISALVEVASTAQSLERHDMPSRPDKSEEIQSHPSSIETSTSRRGRDQDNDGGGKEEEDVNAEATRLGVNGGALLEHQTRAMHNYLLQIMAQAKALPASSATACGAQVKMEDQAQHDEDTHGAPARGWRPSDPAPTSISAAHTSAKRKQASSHRHDTDADYIQASSHRHDTDAADDPADSACMHANVLADRAQVENMESGGGHRPTSPIAALGYGRKAVMHITPAWLKPSASANSAHASTCVSGSTTAATAATAATVAGIQSHTLPTYSLAKGANTAVAGHAAAATAAAAQLPHGATVVNETEVELLASLRNPASWHAPTATSSRVVKPRLRDPTS